MPITLKYPFVIPITEMNEHRKERKPLSIRNKKIAYGFIVVLAVAGAGLAIFTLNDLSWEQIEQNLDAKPTLKMPELNSECDVKELPIQDKVFKCIDGEWVSVP